MTTYLEDLAADLDEYEAAQNARNARASRAAKIGLSSHDLRTLAHIRAETIRVAAITAGATSIANVIARKPVDATQTYNSLPLSPTFSPNVSEQFSRLADGEAYFELCQLWFAAEARLALARELTAAVAVETARTGRPHILQLDTVADAWCRACSSLIALSRMIAQLMAEQGITIYPPNEEEVLTLLDKAAAGLSPCIESDGTFSLPGWAERRKERRRRLALPVQIGVGIKAFPAVLENISSGGLQIATSFMLPVGSRFFIYLKDGRRLEASVRWSDGVRIGAALAMPLDNNDPLWVEEISAD